jgi:hypothetical protein
VLTRQAWDPSNNVYGSMYTPARSVRIRAEQERLDHRVLMEGPKWSEAGARRYTRAGASGAAR